MFNAASVHCSVCECECVCRYRPKYTVGLFAFTASTPPPLFPPSTPWPLCTSDPATLPHPHTQPHNTVNTCQDGSYPTRCKTGLSHRIRDTMGHHDIIYTVHQMTYSLSRCRRDQVQVSLSYTCLGTWFIICRATRVWCLLLQTGPSREFYWNMFERDDCYCLSSQWLTCQWHNDRFCAMI